MGKEVLLIIVLGQLALTRTVAIKQAHVFTQLKGICWGGGCALAPQTHTSSPPCYFLLQHPISFFLMILITIPKNTFIYIL